MTKIQWTNETWNPIVGCSKISEGCKHCYAAEASKSARLQQFEQYQAVKNWDGTLTFVENQLYKPLAWKKPKHIFVCSMSDLFHKNSENAWIISIFNIMKSCPQHTFQILTKRPERALAFLSEFDFNLSNVWLGSSIESQKATSRIDVLRKIKVLLPDTVFWLSCEPLLEDLGEVDLTGISWVIVGGESTQKKKDSRPFNLDWARSLKEQCDRQDAAFFFKQAGSNPFDGKSPLLLRGKGGDLEQIPIDLRIRNFPKI